MRAYARQCKGAHDESLYNIARQQSQEKGAVQIHPWNLCLSVFCGHVHHGPVLEIDQCRQAGSVSKSKKEHKDGWNEYVVHRAC